MSSVTPGRETDALVAEKLGWTLQRIGRGIPPGCEGMKHPVAYPRYSTETADAIAALEATGEHYIIERHPGFDYYTVTCGGFTGSNIDLCTAICAAILQLPTPEPA